MAEPTARITVTPPMRELETVNAWQPALLNWLRNLPEEWRKSYFEPPAVPIDPNAAGKTPEQRYGNDPIYTAMAGADLASIWPGLGALKAVGAAAGIPAAAKAIKRAGAAINLPSLRGLPREEAIALTKGEPHLIKSGEKAEGLYVGGPPDVESKADLNRIRREYDKRVAADPRGGDWYDRTREDIRRVTGSPEEADWTAARHQQWSSGVSPESELAFAIKELNASLAGMPTSAYYPAQHAAHQRALQTGDIMAYQGGSKTGPYGKLINPNQPWPPGAVGTNDFRAGVEWGYPHLDRATPQQSNFMDYETALATKRANEAGLGGRSDWTGEQIQAAPWVTQKARALMEQRGISYEEAMTEAMKTIGDFFPKHRAFATYEAIPGTETKHLPGMQTATAEERAAFSADPRSSWADPQTGRDVIYGGYRTPGTGSAMMVEPSVPTQGVYKNPRGEIETNPGMTALPLIAFEAGKTKSVPAADRALLDAAEATRGLIDAQNAAAWHKVWTGGQAGGSQSFSIPRSGQSNVDELMRLREIGARMGLGDVVDTGKGITMTSFYPGPPQMTPKAAKAAAEEIRGATGVAPIRSKVDSSYIGFEEALQSGQSGAATQEALKRINVTPEIRRSLDENPAIPLKALANMERDAEWSKTHGATSEAYTNLRRIIGEGPGWISRVEAALKKKEVVLPALAALLVPAALPAGREQ